MAQFSIKPDNTQKVIIDEQRLARELASLEDEIRNIKSSLSFRTASLANIRNRLNSASDRVGGYQNGMKRMSLSLNEIVNMYGSTENAIIGNLDVGDAKINKVPGSSGTEEGNTEEPGSFDWSFLWKAVGVAGPVGKIVSTTGKFFTSDKEPAAKWSGLVKDSWSAAWKAADTIKKCRKDTSISWGQAMFGLNPDKFLGSISKSNLSAAQRFQHGFDKGIKGTLREFKTPGGAVKQVGGIILSGVTNAFSNYEEYQRGDISAERAVAETVVETAVDWGKDLLIGAAVTAGLAATGIAAPALAVGAATVAVSAGIDWVCEKVCGKKATELVSDAILDTAEMVGNGIKSGVEVVKNGAEALWKNVASGWNAFTGGLGAVFA